ncbi:NYN domain-containing protein, partial [Ottowia sp.]|uniref:NYN domain-containing protein n=1 Tax=Ottowia sp. TaxID=1898956 RepID=UPI0039E3C8BF
MTDITDRQPRIALLIDADNAPADLIDEILTELSTLGVINVRRAYGNWTKHGLNSWQERLLEFAIRPMQQFDYSRRKNASDMAMTVDAMELLYTERPDAFGIVSSDADFTPLVMHLRAKGAAVYGFGMAQTPKPFINACSRFLYLEALAEAHADAQPDAQAETAGVPVAALLDEPAAARPESAAVSAPAP